MTTTPSAVRNIPLDKLVPSPTNVRKTPPSAAEEAELKASIRARGLKQNLVVHPSPGEKGVHAVTAGGRRLKALRELVAEGAIPADFRVPCLVEEPEAAVETSLMENRIRAALSPADEFVAMAALIASRFRARLNKVPMYFSNMASVASVSRVSRLAAWTMRIAVRRVGSRSAMCGTVMIVPSSISRSRRAAWMRPVRAGSIPNPRAYSRRSSSATMLEGAGDSE